MFVVLVGIHGVQVQVYTDRETPFVTEEPARGRCQCTVSIERNVSTTDAVVVLSVFLNPASG